MKKLILSEHGILPGTDITRSLNALIAECGDDTEFVFEDADYFFSAKTAEKADYRLSNTDVLPLRTLGILLRGKKNCILRGNGARLWFEGQMQPLTLDHCDRVTVTDFVINWRYPLVAEGTILSHTPSTADVFVDPERYPHRYRDGNLEFYVGADEWYPLNMSTHQLYDPEGNCILRGTGDRFWPSSVEEIGTDTYRFHLRGSLDMQDGATVVLRHNDRLHAGIFSEKCKDLTFDNITIHSCGGLGCLAQFCHDLTYRRIRFLPDTAAGRKVSNGHDDGMHLTCNSGTVTVTECSFVGLMDDPINIHGCCVTSDETVGTHTLRCRYRQAQAQGFLYWAEEGDEVVFLDRKTMAPVAKARVASYALETDDTFLLTLSEPIPEADASPAAAGDSLAIDNLSHTAEFVCTDNRFGSCRARGLLVSTPKRVLIADNYFESSGSAILLAGDSNFWYESGACHDVTIRNNIFTDRCLTSIYQFCEGIISICPVVPEPALAPPFHHNIRILDNTFDTADAPILYAFSCEELEVRRNRILRSPSKRWWPRKSAMFNLRYTRNAAIADNRILGSFTLLPLAQECCEGIETDF